LKSDRGKVPASVRLVEMLGKKKIWAIKGSRGASKGTNLAFPKMIRDCASKDPKASELKGKANQGLDE